jgi:alpha-beta hydrolase superfamily lysophospholipase
MEHETYKYDKNEIVTVFFQGNMSARAQAANYAGSEGLDIKISDEITEHVYRPDAPLLLHNIFPYYDLNDVGYGFSINPLHWCLQIKSLVVNTYCNIHGSSISHSYITENNIGGKEDVNQNIRAIHECIKANPSKKIVLSGVSRGAATTLVTLANLGKDLLKHISLVIVEAPFDSVPSVVESSSWFPSLTMEFAKTVMNYDENQQSPLDAVLGDSFPLDIPLAFITSKIDNRVPIKNTLKLIDILKEKGHTKLHHLMLENSHHALMHSHNDEDKNNYIKFVNELYDIYI